MGRISGTETVTVVKFFLNFSESFVPVGRTSGTVTVNIAKYLVNFSSFFLSLWKNECNCYCECREIVFKNFHLLVFLI